MNHLPLSLSRSDTFLATRACHAINRLVKIASAAKASQLTSRLTKNAQVFRTFRRVIDDLVPQARRSLGIFRGSSDFNTNLRDYLAYPNIRYGTTTEFLKRDPSPEEVAQYGAVVRKLDPAFYLHSSNLSTPDARLAGRSFQVPEHEFVTDRTGALMRRIAHHIPWFRRPSYVTTLSEYIAKMFPSLMVPRHPYSDDQLVPFLKDFRRRAMVWKYPDSQFNVGPQHISQPLIEAAAADYRSGNYQGVSSNPIDFLKKRLSGMYNEAMFGGAWMWRPTFQPSGHTFYVVRPDYDMRSLLHELGHVGETSLERLYKEKGATILDRIRRVSYSDPYWTKMFDAASYPITISRGRAISKAEETLRSEVSANQVAEALIERMRAANENIPYIGGTNDYRFLSDRALSSYVEPLHRAVLGAGGSRFRDMLDFAYRPGSRFERFGHPFLDQIIDASARWRGRVLLPEASRFGYAGSPDNHLRRLSARAERAMGSEQVPSELAGPLSVKMENIPNPNMTPLGELYKLRHFLGNLYYYHPELFLGASI